MINLLLNKEFQKIISDMLFTKLPIVSAKFNETKGILTINYKSTMNLADFLVLLDKAINLVSRKWSFELNNMKFNIITEKNKGVESK